MSDCNKQFESELFKELSRMVGFHRNGPHVTTNCQIVYVTERMHWTLKIALITRGQEQIQSLPVVLLHLCTMTKLAGLFTVNSHDQQSAIVPTCFGKLALDQAPASIHPGSGKTYENQLHVPVKRKQPQPMPCVCSSQPGILYACLAPERSRLPSTGSSIHRTNVCTQALYIRTLHGVFHSRSVIQQCQNCFN